MRIIKSNIFNIMSYLQNNICTFTPLFDINYKIKKNLICCSFFKMYNKGYKDFSIYLKGIYVMYNHVIYKVKNYSIRLFIDNSIYKDENIMKILKKMHKLEIVVYECPELLLKNNSNYHEGLFGTLIRFFPMFDFPNNDAKNIFITDIDDIAFKTVLENIHNMVKNRKIKNIYLIKIGNISKNIKYKYNPYKNIITPYCVAQSFVSFLRINYNVMIDFVNNVKKSNEIYSYYYEMIKNNNFNNELMKKYNGTTNFIYGIDEYFVNKTLTEYLIDNKLPFATGMKFEIISPLYYILSKDIYKTHEQIKLLNKFIENILKFIKINYSKNISLENKYKLINNSTYKDSNSESYIKINEYIYKEFIKYYKKDEYKFLFPSYFYDFLLSEKMFGVYEYNIISYYNINYNDIIIKKKIFDEKIMEKLKKLKDKEFE